MRLSRLLASITCMALCLTTAAAPSTNSPDTAAQLLEKARLAAGGTAWDRIQNIHYHFTHIENGTSCDGEEIADLHNERVVQFIDSPDGSRSGIGRQRSWIHRYDITEAFDSDQPTVSALYNEMFGYWSTGHRAQMDVIKRNASYNGEEYAVVQVNPEGGAALDYWINLKTFLIERVQFHDNDGAIRYRVELSDFSRVGGVLIAFHQTHEGKDASEHHEDIVNKVIFNTPVSDTVFAAPGPEHIHGFLPDERAIQIPFELNQNHIVINVYLNGRGPFRFALDTGANNLMTSEVMRIAQLRPGDKVDQYGFGDVVLQDSLVRVHETSVGSLTLRDQTFTVADIPKSSSIDGLIGYQWLQRLPVKIDYANRIVTLYNPDQFQYEGTAKPVALHIPTQFDRHGLISSPAPRVQAEVEGMQGNFDIDTGDFDGILFTHEFARRNALLHRYPVIGTSSRMDVNNMILTKLMIEPGTFRIGDNYVPGVPMAVAPAQQRGMLADSELAGNVGYEMLKAFDVTLDYRHHAMYLEPNNGLPTLDYFSTLCRDCFMH